MHQHHRRQRAFAVDQQGLYFPFATAHRFRAGTSQQHKPPHQRFVANRQIHRPAQCTDVLPSRRTSHKYELDARFMFVAP